MNKLLLIIAIVASGVAIFYANFNRTQHTELVAETINYTCNECIELTKAVEELKLEVEHLHTVDIEIGENLNARIDQVNAQVDEVATSVASFKDDAVAAATQAAESAAARAEAAAEASQAYYEQVVEWFEKIRASLPKIPKGWWGDSEEDTVESET